MDTNCVNVFRFKNLASTNDRSDSWQVVVLSSTLASSDTSHDFTVQGQSRETEPTNKDWPVILECHESSLHW